MRVRAAAIVLRGGQVLLMWRCRGGLQYFAVPGGGVEPGETNAEACLRELGEEMSLAGRSARSVLCDARPDGITEYFLVEHVEGAAQLGGPELARASDANRYEPHWADLADLDSLPIEPVARQAITEAVRVASVVRPR